MIRILTGPVRSYKTTTLMQWAAERDDVAGVLTPDVGDLRVLYNLKERSHIPWQKEKQTVVDDILIGRFVFDKKAFESAVGWLDDAMTDPSVRTITLDEVGPLELRGGGWDGWMVRGLKMLRDKDLVLVVRESIVEDVIRHYGLDAPEVVKREFFAL